VTKQKIMHSFQRFYVKIMMMIVGRSLVGLSKVDKEIQNELEGFGSGYIIEMKVIPEKPSFKLIVTDDTTLKIDKSDQKPDLSVQFKHISHAFMVFAFIESTARSFANDRMIADGELSHAIRLVRCLNKMEAIILPKFIAKLAVKRYPKISFLEKTSKALRIYALVAKQLVTGS